MSRPDEGLIHQWLDGECTPEESARVERLIATDSAWAAAVADARGVIAASARIVRALDAVPRAVPSETVAASHSSRSGPEPRTVRATPWLRLAAGLVLVAGSAYVWRESGDQPTASVTMPAPTIPAAFDSVAGVEIAADSRALQQPPAAPPVGPLRVAGGSAAAGGEAATALREQSSAAAQSPGLATPTLGVTAATAPSAPPISNQAPTVASGAASPAIVDESSAVADSARMARAREERERRMRMLGSNVLSQVVVTGVSADQAKQQFPTPPTEACWRVELPTELLGTLLRPPYQTISGDTLIAIARGRAYRVVSIGERLTGELTAQRTDCAPP